MNTRINSMVEHYKKHHWAKSHLENDDSDFFNVIGIPMSNVGITSFTGSDIVYYNESKVIPWVSSMISISQHKMNLKNKTL